MNLLDKIKKITSSKTEAPQPKTQDKIKQELLQKIEELNRQIKDLEKNEYKNFQKMIQARFDAEDKKRLGIGLGKPPVKKKNNTRYPRYGY